MSWKGDPNAIHTVVDGEIAGLTEKGTPVDADLIVLEDSADSNSKKKAQLGNLPGGTDADAIHDNVAGEIAAVTEKASPVNADLVLIEDSADSNSKKRVQVGNLPGGGGGSGDLTLITHTELASSASAITFSSITGTYKHLLLVLSVRSDRSGNGDDCLMRVGNSTVDSGTNYAYMRPYRGSSSGMVNARQDTSFNLAVTTAANDDADAFSTGEFVIHQYADTTGHRSIDGRGGAYKTSTAYHITEFAGRWRNAADVIDIISLFPNLGSNWVAGSTATLYGMG